MHPELLHWQMGSHTVRVPTYGVAAAVGFACALLVAYRLGRRQGISPDLPIELGFWLLLAAVAGSRLAYVALNWHQFSGKPLEVLAVWKGGLVFYGGVVAALAAGALFVRLRGADGWHLADLVAPGLSLAHALGRLGCLAAGCCFGKPATTGPRVIFGPQSVAYQELLRTHRLSHVATHTPGLHPVQAYEALGEALIFFFLIWTTTRKRFHGAVMLTYLASYACLRFLMELLRGDPTRGYLLRLSTPRLNHCLGIPEHSAALLSTSQAVSLLLLIGSLALLRWRQKTTGPRHK